MQNSSSAVGTTAIDTVAPTNDMSGWTKAIGIIWVAFAALRVIQLLISIPAFSSTFPLLAALCIAFLVWELFQVFCGVWLTQGRDLGRKVIRGVLLVRVFVFAPLTAVALAIFVSQMPMSGLILGAVGAVTLFYAVYFGLSYAAARHLGSEETRWEMID